MIELPDPDSSSTVADWVELQLVMSGGSLGRAKVASVMEQSAGDEPSEAFLTSVWNELAEREQSYDSPAFEVQGNIVTATPRPASKDVYAACLIMSLFGMPQELRAGAKLFERVTAEAMKNYLAGDAIVFGWPVLRNQATPISERVRAVASNLQEKFVEAPRDAYLDRGLDVIAWKPFSELRSNKCVLLAQCATGGNWRGKTRDLPMASWRQYLHWACDPVRAFSVPCIVPKDLWHDVSREAGIIFDRIRIMNLLPNGITDKILKRELRTWIRQQLNELGA